METEGILGLYWGYIGTIWRIKWKIKWKMTWKLREYRGYMGIMEKKMETTGV